MRALLFILVALIAGCSGSKKSSQTAYEPGASDLIKLQRTGCYGTCPIYEVSIFGNGIVSYEGKAHTDYEGKYLGQISTEEASTLFANINVLDWDGYPDEYPIDNVDFPQFFISYKSKKTDRIIKGNSQAAAELVQLSKEIDRLIGSVNLKEQ